MVEGGLDPWMAEHWPAPDDPIALGLAWLPIVLLQRGRLRSGVDALRRAWQRAETLENGAYSMAHVSLNSALFWAAMGDGQAVIEHARDMSKLGGELDAVLWTTLGDIYEQLGSALATPSVEQASAIQARAAMFEGFSGPLAIVLYLYGAQAALQIEHHELAAAMLDGVDRVSSSRGLRQFDAEAMRFRAAIAPLPERASLLADAARTAVRQGAVRYRLRALVDLVEHDPSFLVGKASAAESLQQAATDVPEPEGDPDVERALALVAAAAR